MSLIFGVEEKFEAFNGYDNTIANSDDDWSEIVDAGCTLNPDSTGPASPPSWMENECLYSEVDTDAPARADAVWESSSNQNDNFIRFVFYVSQEGYANNQLGYICRLYDTTPTLVAGIQIGQSSNNLKIRMAYYDGSPQYSSLVDINAHLATNWLMVKFYYHDGSGVQSKSRAFTVHYWDGAVWQIIGGASAAIVGATRTPKAITAGLATNQGTVQNSQIYIDRLWWDDAAFPSNPVAGWTGKIIGVTNPDDIIGVATSGISKVIGVS